MTAMPSRRYPVRDSNPRPPDRESGVFPTRPTGRGTSTRSRTWSLPVRSRALCPLSHGGGCGACRRRRPHTGAAGPLAPVPRPAPPASAPRCLYQDSNLGLHLRRVAVFPLTHRGARVRGPTGIRTRNSSVQARCDAVVTIGPSKAAGNRPRAFSAVELSIRSYPRPGKGTRMGGRSRTRIPPVLEAGRPSAGSPIGKGRWERYSGGLWIGTGRSYPEGSARS